MQGVSREEQQQVALRSVRGGRKERLGPSGPGSAPEGGEPPAVRITCG